jgi:hypothetical protein
MSRQKNVVGQSALFHRVVLCLLLGMLSSAGRIAASAQGQEHFEPPVLEQFDGRGWKDLTFDESTTDDIKKAYKTGKGAYRPEAMVLPQSRDSDINLQVLMNGRGGTSRLVGFRIAYKDGELNLTELARSLGKRAETFYPQERFSDWRVEAFLSKGIIVFVARDGVRDTVPVVVLTTPERATELVRGLSEEPTRIGDFRRRFNPNDVRVEFGSISISHQEKGLQFPDANDVESRIRRSVRENSGSRNLDYRSGGDASYTVRIVLDKPKDKDGKVTVTVTASGTTPFGSVYASGSNTKTFDRDIAGGVSVSRNVILDAFEDARDSMGSEFSRKVRQAMPATPKAYQEIVWNALTTDAVR